MIYLNFTILGSRINKLASALGQLPSVLALVRNGAGRWMYVWAALLVAQGLVPAVTVYLARPFVDSLTAASRAGIDPVSPFTSPEIRAVMFWGLLIVGMMLTTEALQKAASLVRTCQSELLREHITSLIHEKSVAADYAFYDNPEYYDHLHRARSDALYRPEALLDSLGSLTQNSITLLAIGAIIIVYGWWLPAVLILSTLPVLIVIINNLLQQYNWHRNVTGVERRIEYYDWVLTDSQSAAEVRLFNLGGHYRAAWRELIIGLRRQKLGLARRHSVSEFAVSTFSMAITAGALGWMAWQAMLGGITLGVLALFYQSLNQGQRIIHSVLENLGQLYSNSLFLGNLFEFLELEPTIVDPQGPLTPPARLHQGISFRDVSFIYPAGHRIVLSNFTLDIPAGKMTSIVGLNGAGKSTLFKLICRLYDVDSGSILLDGVDIRHLRPADLRSRITMLFQNPVHYSQTVDENISIGDIEKDHPPTDIQAAAISAGADQVINKLPHGYRQQLGIWFPGGTDLSTGEWQRIALARAFLRQAPIILLDEPTSAMDSWAEAEWMRRFRDLASDKTSIIITHRFTTAMQADQIHVMVDGKIVESGTHDQLVAKGGLYANSWAEQTRKF